MSGRLFTFEGIDGSGKSTQAKLLKERLSSLGHSVHLLREPGGTKIGEKIRNILLDTDNNAMCDNAELFLYLAARAQICSELISPALARGDIVILDRFIDSTVAYQGYARGLGIDETIQLNLQATSGLMPDRTFVVDCEPELAMSRLDGVPDRLESEGILFMKRVREGFLALCERDSERVICVDGRQSITEIAEIIWDTAKTIID